MNRYYHRKSFNYKYFGITNFENTRQIFVFKNRHMACKFLQRQMSEISYERANDLIFEIVPHDVISIAEETVPNYIFYSMANDSIYLSFNDAIEDAMFCNSYLSYEEAVGLVIPAKFENGYAILSK